MVEESDRAEAESLVQFEQTLDQMSTEDVERLGEQQRQEFLRAGGTEAEYEALLRSVHDEIDQGYDG